MTLHSYHSNRRCIYRYYLLPEDVDAKEEPLVNCPECGRDLTEDKAITVDIPNNTPFNIKTRLDGGVLQDTVDLKILRLGVESVNCAACSIDLAGLDNVYEEELLI